VIIGIAGKMCSGKDTTAQRVLAGLDATDGGQRFAFGDLMKEMACATLCQLTGVAVEREAKDDRLRTFYQLYANAIRAYDEDAWVTYTMGQVRSNLATYGGSALITDVRYPNEAQAVRDAGGILVRCHCDEETRLQRIAWQYGPMDPARLTHISEIALDAWRFDLYVDTNTRERASIGIHNIINCIQQERRAAA